jgi:Zn-dependent peptidase ImmA (M78 family)
VRSEELIELASLYGRPVSELLREREPVPAFGVQLRGAMRRQPVDEDLAPYLDELERLCDDYVWLEELCSAPLRRHYPPEYDVSGADAELIAEDVAASERQRLGLGDGPLPDLRELLETQVGLRIFQPDLPSDVAGLFAFTEEHGGCIAVNRRHPPERRRQSLGHEYGHFLTRRLRPEVTVLKRYARRPREEIFAETFGRALLMHAGGLRRRFLDLERERKGSPTHGDLCRLAHAYGISVEAMTRRLEEIDLIPAGTWDRLRLAGFEVREARRALGLEPLPAADKVVPPRFVFLAIEAWQDGELSEGQLAGLLRTDRIAARRLVAELADSSAGLSLGRPLVDAT